MADRILTRTQRTTARLCTGPLAHLAAGLIDWLVLVGRLGRARWRQRPER